MAAKGTKTEAAAEKPTTRRAPAKKAPAQPAKTARAKKSTTSRATKSAKAQALSHEVIAERAYYISHSEHCGTDEENWHRAEAELRQGV
jgi:hypothetical protein